MAKSLVSILRKRSSQWENDDDKSQASVPTAETKATAAVSTETVVAVAGNMFDRIIYKRHDSYACDIQVILKRKDSLRSSHHHHPRRRRLPARNLPLTPLRKREAALPLCQFQLRENTRNLLISRFLITNVD